uniref:Uncharacterized protein n=1 Tax=Timema douglasi TaxID=61478 RepID=A0A7R8VQK3_TIMDO|nr:unnamed protein product [Timema douglasi]
MAQVNKHLLRHSIILGLDDRGKLSCHKVNLCFIYFDTADCIKKLQEVIDREEREGRPVNREETAEERRQRQAFQERMDIEDRDIIIQGSNTTRLSRETGEQHYPTVSETGEQHYPTVSETGEQHYRLSRKQVSNTTRLSRKQVSNTTRLSRKQVSNTTRLSRKQVSNTTRLSGKHVSNTTRLSGKQVSNTTRLSRKQVSNTTRLSRKQVSNTTRLSRKQVSNTTWLSRKQGKVSHFCAGGRGSILGPGTDLSDYQTLPSPLTRHLCGAF